MTSKEIEMEVAASSKKLTEVKMPPLVDVNPANHAE